LLCTPSTVGKRQATLHIILPNDTLKQTISGQGMEKKMQLPNVINMGKVTVGQKKDSTVSLVENLGNTALTFTNLQWKRPNEKQFQTTFPEQIVLDGKNKNQSIDLSFSPIQRGRTSNIIQLKESTTGQYIKVKVLGEGEAPTEVVIRGKTLNSKNKQPLPASLHCYDLMSGRLLKKIETKTDGNYQVVLPVDRNYSIVAEKKDFLGSSENIDLRGLIMTTQIEKDVWLTPLEQGAIVRLNNIFFEFAKAALTEESEAELDRMVEYMQQLPTLVVEIGGHTDHVGSNASNLSLSQQRSESVRNYILSKGVDKNRLTAKGYGETKPFTTNSTEVGRKLNRRVEFKILEL